MQIKTDANYFVVSVNDDKLMIFEATTENLTAYNRLFKNEHAFVRRYDQTTDGYEEVFSGVTRYGLNPVRAVDHVSLMSGADVAKRVAFGQALDAREIKERAQEKAAEAEAEAA